MKASDIRNIILIFSLFGLLAQFSCKKEEDDLLVPRIFRPVANVDNTMDNVLIVYFKSIEGAEVYEADISLDSTFLTIEQSITIDPDTAEIIYESTKYSYIIFSELLAAQEYFIRVKAIHADSTMSSGYYVFYAQTLNIFVNPTVSEILDVAFKCKWDVKGELLTKIVVRLTENDSLISENWVLDVENKTGVRVIDGLEGNTTYSVYLYSGNLFSGTTLRGKGTITTQPAIEGNIVDLRFMESNTALWDTIHK